MILSVELGFLWPSARQYHQQLKQGLYIGATLVQMCRVMHVHSGGRALMASRQRLHGHALNLPSCMRLVELSYEEVLPHVAPRDS